MKILFLSVTYDDKENPVNQRARQMQEQGHDVELVWIRVPRSKANQPWPSRLFGMIPAYVRATLSALSPKNFDMIIAPTSPPLIFVPAAVRARLLGEDVTLLHHDIFPENARVADLEGPDMVFHALELAFAALAKLAKNHETLSLTMAKTLEQKLGSHIQANVVPLSIPQFLEIIPKEKNRWLKEKGFDGKFVVMYAGNFGRMYDFDPMLKAAEVLKENKDISFVFVGAGFYENKIRNAKQTNCLDNVYIFSPEPEERVSEVLCAADLHIVPLRSGADSVMWPHKIDILVELGLKVIAVGFDPGMAGVAVVQVWDVAGHIGRNAKMIMDCRNACGQFDTCEQKFATC